VCFDVYGHQVEKLGPAFIAHLEAVMSLPIHREGEYQLKPLVCREWYDDYYWSPPKEITAEIVEFEWGGSRGVA
jgi:hypothetical protein